MATVPRLTTQSVAPTSTPDFRQQSTVSADLLNVSAKQAGQAGDAIASAGATFDAVERQMVERANVLRVDDAINKATEQALRLQHDKEGGYTAAKGYDALNRESGQPLAVEFTGKLDQTISGIADSLGNERQKQLFGMKVNNLRTTFMGQATAYESAQYQEYNLSVRDATVKNAGNALVLNYGDPENVNMQTTRIRAAILGAKDPESGVWVQGSAQMQGKSAAWAEEKAAEAVSGAHLGAIQSAMESGNIGLASSYRQRYGKELTAADMLKIDGTLTRNNETMRGAAVATQVLTGAQSAIQPTSMDRLTNVVMGIESGGKDFDKSGNILTSPAGAKGRMQVLDGTNKDPGFGVRPAADDSPEERARVGRDYLGAMVKRYDGNVAQAAAAYNWGPGAVDKAIKERGADWLSAAPAETKAYVANVQKRMGDATGTGAAGSVPPRPTLEQLQTEVRTRLGAGASPFAVKAGVDAVTAQFEAQTKAIAQRKDETVAEAMQTLAQNGGRYSELPPAMRAKLTQLAPEKVDEVMAFGQKIAKGDNTTDPALYLKLTDAPTLRNLSDAQFYQLRGRLSESDFQHFSNQRANEKKPGANQPGNLDTGAISRVTNSRLQSIGMDPTPKDGSNEAIQVGTMRRFIDASLLDAQNSAGKKFTDVEVQSHIDGLFAKNVTFRKTFLGVTYGDVQGQPLLTMKYGDIPAAQVDTIKKAFAQRGNSNPTEGDILGAYFAGKSKQAPSTGGAQGNF